MAPLFSVIIPIYNIERYLKDAIESVLEQNFKDFEIVLVNDASTDRSGEICNDYSRNHPSVKTVHHYRNLGVSASRNDGIKKASGKYIIFLDSDDCFCPGALNGIAQLIEGKHNPDVIIGKWNSPTQESNLGVHVADKNNPEDVINHINTINFFIGFCWRYIINRDFILKNKLYFINAKIHEDIEFVVRMLCLSRSFASYLGDFYQKKVRENSLTSLTNDESTFSCLRIAYHMAKFIHENNLSNSKLKFVQSKIEFILSYLTPRLILQNQKTLHRFSKEIENELGDLNIFKSISFETEISSFIKNFGARRGLILYKSSIIDKTLALISNKKYRELYIFCVGLFGETTARILLNEGICINGFFDNGECTQGRSVLNLEVKSPIILTNKSKQELSEVIVLVCNQRTEHAQAISDQLHELGLSREQIIHKVY